MPTIVYNKLIRDNIPEIIKSKGKQPFTEILNNSDYILKLNEKLQEELDEYKKDGTVEELADLVEVVYAVLKYKNVSLEEFENIRKVKTDKRGAFDKRLLLKEVIE